MAVIGVVLKFTDKYYDLDFLFGMGLTFLFLVGFFGFGVVCSDGVMETSSYEVPIEKVTHAVDQTCATVVEADTLIKVESSKASVYNSADSDLAVMKLVHKNHYGHVNKTSYELVSKRVPMKLEKEEK